MIRHLTLFSAAAFFIGVSLCSQSIAEEPLNEVIKKMDEKNIAQTVQKTLALMDEMDRKQKSAQQPLPPISPIPVPGQPAPLLKNYPSPIPSAEPITSSPGSSPGVAVTAPALHNNSQDNASAAITIPGAYNTEAIKNNQQLNNNFYR